MAGKLNLRGLNLDKINYDTIKHYSKNNKYEIILGIILILGFIYLGYVSYSVFNNYPASYDEYSYLYQAKIFLNGNTYATVEPGLWVLRETHTSINNGKVYTNYPPGFSLILALGLLIHLEGFVNPLLGILTLYLIYLIIKRFYDKKVALIATTLALITPYFFGYASSYYSQALAGFLVTLTTYLTLKYYECNKSKYLVWMGISIGYLIITRQLDAFCIFIPTFAVLMLKCIKDKNYFKIVYFLIPLIVFTLILCLYNYHQTGNFNYTIINNGIGTANFNTKELVSTNTITSPTQSFYFKNLIKFTAPSFFNSFIPLLNPVIVLLSIMGLFLSKNKWKYYFLMIIIMFITLYNFHSISRWDPYGARYYYPLLSSIIILAILGIYSIYKEFLINSPEIYKIIVFGSIILLVLSYNIIIYPPLVKTYKVKFDYYEMVNKDIDNTCPSNNTIIVLSANNNISSLPPYFEQYGFLRNPFFKGPKYYVYYEQSVPYITPYLKNYTVCRYNFSILEKNRFKLMNSYTPNPA